jgi:hypothetical protein
LADERIVPKNPVNATRISPEMAKGNNKLILIRASSDQLHLRFKYMNTLISLISIKKIGILYQ